MLSNIPRIGITCDFDTALNKHGLPSPQYTLSEDYVNAVLASGGEPWLLPHLPIDHAEKVVEQLDGLIISGGFFDVPPSFYGEAIRRVDGIREVRSAFERALILQARKILLPLLGICGGMQIINVALGGTLYQDDSERPDTQEHEQPRPKTYTYHNINISEKSRLAKVVQTLELEVNSTHHQMVRNLGSDLHVSAVAPDGVIEAIETNDSHFLLGVQWHPEALLKNQKQLAIYQGLISAARERG
ncbi:MAG: gamma-glutamyl-gamma-aminobutyrate hydrolase family protein [Deltaproteobacteria bacterium]|nr:gamma-glutamyl-gamma-aminobutyrate hydrolase family protein [Deltaproteobacteria bacterium]